MPRLFIALLLVLLFAALAWAANSGFSQPFDDAVLRWLYDQTTPLWNRLAVTITDSGDIVGVSIITVLLAGGLLYSRRRPMAARLVATVLAAVWLNLTLKLLFKRERPDLWATVVQEQSLSFPSGHAMVSAALAAVIILIFWRTKWRWPALGVAALYSGLIGLSRMYLGVHYPTDVLAGWVAGLFVALVVWRLSSGWSAKSQQ